MAVNYQQTDSAAPDGAIAACSGGTLATTVNPRLASTGGTAGSTPVVAGGANWDTGTSRIIWAVELTPSADTTWAGGTWTVRMNVTTAQASTTLSAIHICRLNSAGVSQATIGSATGLSIALTTTGVKSQDVTGSVQTPGAGDKVYIVFIGSATANNRQISITPDQIISSPFTVPVDTPLTPTVGALALDGVAPTVDAQDHHTAAPLVGALALEGVAPTVIEAPPSEDTPITPGTGVLTMSIAGQSAAPAVPTGVLTLTGEAPSLFVESYLTPEVGALIAEGAAPTVRSEIFLTPGSGVLVAEGVAPTAIAASSLTPEAGALTITGIEPSLFVETFLTPDAGALVADGIAPRVFIEESLTPEAGALTLEGAAPTTINSEGEAREPHPGALVLEGVAPTLEVTGFVELTPVAGALAFDGAEVVAIADVALAPEAAAAALEGIEPVLVGGTILQPEAGGLTAEGVAPALFLETFLTPGPGTLVAEGVAPTLDAQGDKAITPNTGALVAEGVAPTIEMPAPTAVDEGGWWGPWQPIPRVELRTIRRRTTIVAPRAGALGLRSAAPRTERTFIDDELEAMMLLEMELV